MNGLVTLEPHVAGGFVGGEIVEDDVDLALRIGGDDPVHEIEELDPSAPLIVAADDFSAFDIQRGEQRGGPVTFVVVRLAGHGAPAGQLEIALRPLKGLDGRFFVDGEHDGVVGGSHVEPDDLGRLGREFGIVADAPGLAPGKVDLVRPQKPPVMLDLDVAERLGDLRPGPVGAALRRRRIEHRQDAPAGLLAISGFSSTIAGLGKAGQTILRIAHPPLRRRPGRAHERPANRPRRRAVRRHQDDARLEARAVLRLGRTRQVLKPGPLLTRQYDRGSLHQGRSCNLESRLNNQR